MDIQNFFHWDEFWQFQEVTLWRLLASFLLAAVSGTIMSQLYQKTYRGSGYTQSMSQTIILLACIVSVIMIVIGSNIARAFSLVGALSIIRFRTAVKSTRDTAFIFLTLALGMAAGSRFYATGIVATLLFSVLILILHYADIGGEKTSAQILKMRFPPNVDPEEAVKSVFSDFLESWNMLSVETVQQGALTEAVYQVQLKGKKDSTSFIEMLRTLNENEKIVLFHPDREISL